MGNYKLLGCYDFAAFNQRIHINTLIKILNVYYICSLLLRELCFKHLGAEQVENNQTGIFSYIGIIIYTAKGVCRIR